MAAVEPLGLTSYAALTVLEAIEPVVVAALVAAERGALPWAAGPTPTPPAEACSGDPSDAPAADIHVAVFEITAGGKVRCVDCGREGYPGGGWQKACRIGHPFSCEGCARVFATAQGLGTHRRSCGQQTSPVVL